MGWDDRTSVVGVETHDRAGRGSSGRSGSMLMKSRENRPKIELSLYSYDRLLGLREEFGETLTFRKTGFLSAVPDVEAERYRLEHELRVEMGVPSELVSQDDMLDLAPGLVVDDLAFGVHCPDDGEIDAWQIMRVYEAAGRRLGVVYEFERRAVGLVIESSRVVGVET